jgi:IMP dehydrogenase/GMP reductase
VLLSGVASTEIRVGGTLGLTTPLATSLAGLVDAAALLKHLAKSKMRMLLLSDLSGKKNMR